MESLKVIRSSQITGLKSQNSVPGTVGLISEFLLEALPKKNYRPGKLDDDQYRGLNFVFFKKSKFNLPLGWLAFSDSERYVELWVFRSAESIIKNITEILEKYSREFDCEVNLSVLQNY